MITLKGENNSYGFEPNDIASFLGKGGMGTVYKGIILESRTHVAIKEIHNEIVQSIANIERAKREASIIIRHKNLIQNMDFIRQNGSVYIVSEFIEGITLRQHLDKQPQKKISGREAIFIMSDVLDGLSYLHRNDIIHRDIDPSNIMLSKEGIVKLMDFGISKKLNLKESTLTGTGQFIGKLQYASPEQIKGETKAIEARSDIYSAGILFYELLSGSRPFESTNIYDLMILQINEPLPKNQSIPEYLFKIIQVATEKQKNDRYKNADLFKSEIIKSITFDLPLANADNYYKSGKDKLDKYKFQEARDDFAKAIHLDSSKVSYFYNKAKCEEELGNYSVAIDDYSRAIEISPKDDILYFNRGNCYSKNNKYLKHCISDFWMAFSITRKKEYFEKWVTFVAKSGNLGILTNYIEEKKLFSDIVYFERGKIILNKSNSANFEHVFDDFLMAFKINPQKKYLEYLINYGKKSIWILNTYIEKKLPYYELACFERGKIFLDKKTSFEVSKGFQDVLMAYHCNKNVYYLEFLLNHEKNIEFILNLFIENDLPLADKANFEYGRILLAKTGYENRESGFRNILRAYQISKQDSFLTYILDNYKKDEDVLNFYIENSLPFSDIALYQRGIIRLNNGKTKDGKSDIKKANSIGYPAAKHWLIKEQKSFKKNLVISSIHFALNIFNFICSFLFLDIALWEMNSTFRLPFSIILKPVIQLFNYIGLTNDDIFGVFLIILNFFYITFYLSNLDKLSPFFNTIAQKLNSTISVITFIIALIGTFIRIEKFMPSTSEIEYFIFFRIMELIIIILIIFLLASLKMLFKTKNRN